jgi:hypothetical protein
MPLGISVTDLEIEEAIREAWAVLSAGSAASPSARRLAAALLAVTGGTQAHPHTPDDLWRDRLAVLADQGAWLASWGPRPGEPDCRVPPALLPESWTRRENAYALWRSTTRASTDVDSESKNLFAGRTACGRMVWIQRLGCTEGEYPVGIVERRSYGGQP